MGAFQRVAVREDSVRSMVARTLALVTAVALGPVAAGHQQPSRVPTPLPPAAVAPSPGSAAPKLFGDSGKDLYGSLFTSVHPAAPKLPAPSAVQPDRSKPRVVCGMTIYRVGPERDPKMVFRDDRHINFPMRVVEPTVCVE